MKKIRDYAVPCILGLLLIASTSSKLIATYAPKRQVTSHVKSGKPKRTKRSSPDSGDAAAQAIARKELGQRAAGEFSNLTFDGTNEPLLFEKGIPGFVRISAGTFMRGLDGRAYEQLIAFEDANKDHEKYARLIGGALASHPVKVGVPYDYFISETLVTNKEFATFIAETGYTTSVERYRTGWVVDNNARWTQGAVNSWRLTHWTLKPDLPAVQLSFLDAMTYASWLSHKLKVKARLPSLEEWELAARDPEVVNDPVLFSWGNDFAGIDKKLNCIDESLGWFAWRHLQLNDGFPFASPVRAFPASKRGLYDALGNAWTWLCTTEAEHLERYKSEADYVAKAPQVDLTDNPRMEMKGGCFYSRVQHANLLANMAHPAMDGSIDVGFRVVIVRSADFGLSGHPAGK